MRVEKSRKVGSKIWLGCLDHNISEYKTSAEELNAALAACRNLKSSRKTSSESLASSMSGPPSLIDVGSKSSANGTGVTNGYVTDEFNDSDDSDEDDDYSLTGKPTPKGKNQKSKTHPKFRHKNETERRNSRTRIASTETKKRMYCCTFCEYQNIRIGQLQKHFTKAHNIEHVTPDMIKTKISNGTANGVHQTSKTPTALPTTGRPVLMTPSGPISMRNMRREPTQEELVSRIFS